MIDVNVSIGTWPFRNLPCADMDVLLPKLGHHGIESVWLGNLEGLFHKDIAGVNARLADQCAMVNGVEALAFGSVNLTLPNWEEDVRRCDEIHGMRGIRLHPNYHGYTLDDPKFKVLLQNAAERNLIVQLAVTMEDERMMHPLMRVEHVDTTPLVEVLAGIPNARVMLLNAFRAIRGKAIDALVDTGQVDYDIAWLEGTSGIESIRKQIPVEHLLLGTHSPLFYYESSLLKLSESPLSDTELEAITTNNARALLA